MTRLEQAESYIGRSEILLAQHQDDPYKQMVSQKALQAVIYALLAIALIGLDAAEHR